MERGKVKGNQGKNYKRWREEGRKERSSKEKGGKRENKRKKQEDEKDRERN